jgi:pimeloyl-ACP methyl ester carboxylesterase
MFSKRALAALIGVVVALLAGLTSPVARANTQHPTWSGRWSVPVDGDVANGWLAYPTDTTPDTLLVFGHGCCGRVRPDAVEFFVTRFAREHGVVAVAMDYRGRSGWDVLAGSRDTIAATEELRRRFPIRQTIAWGVSMGAEVTGMAIAERPDLFDWWVSSIGVLDLVEQWKQGTFQAQIEAETGGPPASHRAEYDRRSPSTMIDRFTHLKRIYLLTGAADLTVPPTQTWEMNTALVDAGIPVTTFTITTSRQDYETYWPTRYRSHDLPVAPAGHDHSSFLLTERILVSIMHGTPLDDGAPPVHRIWDGTLDTSVDEPVD